MTLSSCFSDVRLYYCYETSGILFNASSTRKCKLNKKWGGCMRQMDACYAWVHKIIYIHVCICTTVINAHIIHKQIHVPQADTRTQYTSRYTYIHTTVFLIECILLQNRLNPVMQYQVQKELLKFQNRKPVSKCQYCTG